MPKPLAASPAEKAGASLPTLPRINDRQPEAFDAGGCRATGGPQALPKSGDCAGDGAKIAAIEAGTSENDWRILAGFTGRRYTTNVSANTVRVLEETVLTQPTPNRVWAATGLVRNETANAVPSIEVTASLLDAAGQLVSEVKGVAMVAAVRPGEPAPFRLTADAVDWSEVASVRWSAAKGDTGGAPPSSNPNGADQRAFQIATFWTRPTGGRPMKGDLYADAEGPDAHVVFGSVTNVGTSGVGPASVVAAWIDASGRVVAVAATPTRSADGPPAVSIASAASADYLLVVPPPEAAQLSDLTPMLWAAA